jgi:hypothetical protein
VGKLPFLERHGCFGGALQLSAPPGFRASALHLVDSDDDDVRGIDLGAVEDQRRVFDLPRLGRAGAPPAAVNVPSAKTTPRP